MTTNEMNRKTIEMLLNGDTAGLKRQADEMSRELKHQMGENCPECGGTNVASNGHGEHICIDCDHRWGFDCGERYGF